MRYTFFSLAEFAGKREIIRAILKEYCQDQSELLYVALNEAVNNAFFHGYHGCQDKQKALVQVFFSFEGEEFVIMVRHEGKGIQTFGQRQTRDELSLEDHGRGLDIIGNCTDSYKYNAEGNEIVMRKRIVAAKGVII
ncbi:MAG: ATP-binding protein [Negativicutes bacterium]|nr:ATP-binding protein [Negativicutes bacterium]